jgi:hypothetical protein
MGAHVILNDFRHQPCDCPSDARDEMHDLLTAGFSIQRPLDALNLASDTSYARQQLLLFTDRV